jgi:hypothetical protein
LRLGQKFEDWQKSGNVLCSKLRNIHFNHPRMNWYQVKTLEKTSQLR